MSTIERLIIDSVPADYPDDCHVSCLSDGKHRGIIVVTKAGLHHGHAVYVIVEDEKGTVHIGLQPIDAELSTDQVMEQVNALATKDIWGRHFNLTFRRVPVLGIVKAGKLLVGLLRKGESILCQTDSGQIFTEEVVRIIVLHSRQPGS